MDQSFGDIIASPGLGPVIIISIVTIPLTAIATILRLVATRRSGRRLAWDDLFAVLALVGHLGYTVTPAAALGQDTTNLTDEQVSRRIAKLGYIATPFFYVNQLFAKASLFVVYYRIFWSDVVFVRWIYALAAVHVAWFITFFFIVLFLCKPISKWWDVTGTQPGTCIDGNAFLVSEEGINSSVDLLMVGLTIAMALKLQTREHIKKKLAFVFAVGGMSGIIGFIKIGIIYSTPNSNGQENNANGFWDILQMTTSIFCACAPMYKTIVPIQGVWERLKWSATSWSGNSMLGPSNSGSYGSSKDRRSSNPSRKGSGPEVESSWGGLVHRPNAATADSDVELVELHMPSNKRSNHTRHFQESDMV